MKKPKQINSRTRTAQEASARATFLIETLAAQVETLRDASMRSRPEIIRRVLRTVLKLRPTRLEPEALAEVFESSGYNGEGFYDMPEVSVDGDMLDVRGHFSIKELQTKLAW